MDHTSRLLGALGLGRPALLGRPRRAAHLYGLGDPYDPTCPPGQQADPECVAGCNLLTGGCSTGTCCVPATSGGVSFDWSAICRMVGICKSGYARPPSGVAPPPYSVPWYSTTWGTVAIGLGAAAVVGGGIYLAVK